MGDIGKPSDWKGFFGWLGRRLAARRAREFQDHFGAHEEGVTGHLQIVKRYLDGREEIIGDHNLIVNQGRAGMAILLSGDDVAHNYIPEQMAWGDQGHNPGDPTQPLPVATTETGLNHETLRKTLSTHDFPDTTTVRFIATVETTELVGAYISEAGLFFHNGNCVARKNFGRILHTSDFSLEFRWKIIF